MGYKFISQKIRKFESIFYTFRNDFWIERKANQYYFSEQDIQLVI